MVIAEAFLFHKKGTGKAFRFLFFQAESLFHNTQESLGSVLLSSAASASAESLISFISLTQLADRILSLNKQDFSSKLLWSSGHI